MNPASTPLDEAFDRFWAAYPPRRPNPKAIARKAFAKLVKAGEEPEALIKAAEAFKSECRRLQVPELFIPHARTWLSQRRFEDYASYAENDAQAGDSSQERGDSSPDYSGISPVPLLPLAAEIGEVPFRSWIAPLRFESRGPQLLVLAPTRLHADWIKANYAEPLRRHLRVSRLVIEVKR